MHICKEGIYDEIKGFRLYDPTNKKLTISHDIIFNKEEIQNSKLVEISIVGEVYKAHDTLPNINTSPKSSHIMNNSNSSYSSDTKTPLRKFQSFTYILVW